MATVEVSRQIAADPAELRAAMTDIEPFMKAAGFDDVSLDGDELYLAMTLGFARMELTVQVDETETAVLAFHQIDGIFESMTTEYTLESENDHTTVTASTEFSLGGVVGSVLDATIIKRQRTREFDAQFDWLEDTIADA